MLLDFMEKELHFHISDVMIPVAAFLLTFVVVLVVAAWLR